MIRQGDSLLNETSIVTRGPKTTVIIPCHNYGQFLSWAISSALHQSRPPKEILVIDDSSTDNTDVVAAAYKDKISYFRVNFRCAQQTRNFGLAQATGEYILFLDADDFLDNQALELLERELDSDESLKLAYSGRYNFGNWQEFDELDFDYTFIPSAFDITQLRQDNYITMPSLFRRSGFPGFDPKIKRFQDWDAWLSFLSSNTDAKCVPFPLHHARFHGRNKTLNVESSTERFKVMAKHGLLNINNYGATVTLPNSFIAVMPSPVKIFIIVKSPQAAHVPLLNNFIQCVAPAVRGMVVEASNPDVSAMIEKSAEAFSVPTTLNPSDNLDVLLTAALQHPAFRDADWLIIGNFSSTIRIDELLKHHDTPGSFIVTSTTFDWSLGLAQAPFVAFNRQAVQDFFHSFIKKAIRRKLITGYVQPDHSFLRSLYVLWGRYIGWRLRTNSFTNDNKN